MALTITEELLVLTQAETPGTGIGPETNPLSEIVYQAAVGESVDFLAGAKDTTADPVAAEYIRKVNNVQRRVGQKDNITLDTMRKVLITFVGDSVFTFAQVSGADEAQWISLITGGIVPDVNMTKLFEIVGGVYPYEKTAYDAL